ncbi:MAG: PAS domain-containing protein [Defluviitaleaceae bacterium]|nr:PAS domain-containing protein [Defluviitaleaceae bacterium]
MVEIIIRVGEDGKSITVENNSDTASVSAASVGGRKQYDENMRTALFESNPNASMLFNHELVAVDCNPSACQFFNFRTREALLNGFFARIDECIPKVLSNGQHSVPFKERLKSVVHEGHIRFETEFIMFGGERSVAIDLEKIPFGDDFVIALDMMDLTGFQEIEKEYQSSKEQNEMQMAKINLAIKSAKLALWEVEFVSGGIDLTDNVYTWSDELRNMLGYDDLDDFPNTMEGFGTKIHPEDSQRVLDAFSAHITDKTDETPYDIEYRAIKKDGSIAYLHSTCTTFRNPRGIATRCSGAAQDITEAKEALRSSANQLRRFDLAVKASKIGLWEMDVISGANGIENKFTFTPQLRQILGYTNETDFPNEFDSVTNAIHPDERDAILNELKEYQVSNEGALPFDVEHRMIKKNGDTIYVHVQAEATRDKDGNVVRITGTLMDITNVKNLILEAEKQKEEAEAANKAKSSFLSTMSHEIRTPMNAILGITEIQLQNEDLDPSVREGLAKIYASGDMLLSIINDILDLSKIEAGKLELSVEKYEIASLVSDTAQLNMMRIGSKPIEFEVNVDDNVPTYVMGDELRVKQILNNLLSNAFKYSKSGTVALSVLSQPNSDNADMVDLIVSVKDTGLGMSPEQVAALFDEYSRFNMAANRNTEGTGLGMSITRNMINLMNGEIFIESELGVGSTFTVSLPQGIVADSPPLGAEMAQNLHNFRTSRVAQMKRAQISREPMPYGKVLIVDDVETNIYVARGLMASYKLNIDSAESGLVAIEKVKTGAKYDIIFMDHMMPEMDGMEATKRLREMGYTEPIVALTANAVSGQANVFLSNGFDNFLSKPIDVRQLNNILNKLIRDKQPQDVLDNVRKQAGIVQDVQNTPDDTPSIDPHFAEIFVRDATKSLALLNDIINKGEPYNEEDLRTYQINTHGMKSALANVGNKELSAIAKKLEDAGRAKDTIVITAETPAFLTDLTAFIESIKPNETDNGVDVADEDIVLLNEKLNVIKAAAQDYDEVAIEVAFEELKQKQWSKTTKELFGKIDELLLHSDFDVILTTVGKFLDSNLNKFL